MQSQLNAAASATEVLTFGPFGLGVPRLLRYAVEALPEVDLVDRGPLPGIASAPSVQV